jgi:hypothetical protein
MSKFERLRLPQKGLACRRTPLRADGDVVFCGIVIDVRES